MNILVLSDFHIGQKALATELCPYPEAVNKDENFVSKFIEKAKDIKTTKGEIDFIVIPGDITNQSNIIEYDCGDKFIAKILAELSVDEEKVIFVPGNHDVDWSVLEGTTIYEPEKAFRRSHKYNTIKDSRHRFSKYSNPELLQEPYIKIWTFPNVDFVGFNSSWHDDSIELKHYGLIQMDHIESLRARFEKLEENKLRIFVVHHHLHQFSNPHPNWRDISIMQNGQSLLELLADFKFQFVLHGHRHVPNFISTTLNGSNTVNILCAGSYSCEVPTDIAGYIGNMFHLLQIEDVVKCKGAISTWTYDNRQGWVESKNHSGMDHINPFGCEIDFDLLVSQCESEISNNLSNSPYCEYSEVLQKIPDLKFLQLNSKKRLFEILTKKLSIKVTHSYEDETIFIKTK